MKRTIEYIRKSLINFYSRSEIESFISLIFDHFYNYSKHELILYADKKLDEPDFNSIKKIVARLQKQEPIQYVLGQTEFYGLSFQVSPAVLIPRQETEELVNLILKRYPRQKIKLLDIGTGSGCIPITIKKNNQNILVYSCDVSEDAIELAQKNAVQNAVQLVLFQHDILSDKELKFSGFDVVVSNPPYVTLKEMQVMEKNVLDYEPHLALFVPNDDPLLFYRVIIEKTKSYLNPEGEIYFEINEAYGKSVAELLTTHNFDAEIIKDINQKDRIVFGKKRPE